MKNKKATLRQNSALVKQQVENSMQKSLLRRWGMLWALAGDDISSRQNSWQYNRSHPIFLGCQQKFANK